MYGIQTMYADAMANTWFENDVKMYGIQTILRCHILSISFENDVKMYGIQTKEALEMMFNGLRMM